MPTHTTRQPQNIVFGLGVVYRTVHMRTMLAHHALHCKNLETAIQNHNLNFHTCANNTVQISSEFGCV